MSHACRATPLFVRVCPSTIQPFGADELYSSVISYRRSSIARPPGTRAWPFLRRYSLRRILVSERAGTSSPAPGSSQVLVTRTMVLAGRLVDAEQRTVGALVNIGFLLLFTALVLARIGLILCACPAFGRWVILGICALFASSTVGNLLALDLRERLIFTPVTLIAAVLAARVARGA